MTSIGGAGVRIVSEASLERFATHILVGAGVSATDAAATANVLVCADLRGVTAHGVARLPSYVRRIRSGAIAVNAMPAIERETPTSLVLAANGGLGPPVARRAMLDTIEKARTGGVAFAAVSGSNHFGIAGYYAMLALEHDMIGIAATNAPRTTAPTFGTDVLIGANPWAYAIPAGEEPAFVLDFATSQLTSPGRTLDDVLLPLGGAGTDNGGHKGYGLGLLVDVMCAVLAEGAFGGALPANDDDSGPGRLSHFFGAIRIDGFRDVAAFKAAVDHELRGFKTSERAPGFERLYVAGEIEAERTLAARANGVPVAAYVWLELTKLAGELGVPLPSGA